MPFGVESAYRTRRMNRKLKNNALRKFIVLSWSDISTKYAQGSLPGRVRDISLYLVMLSMRGFCSS